MVTIAITTEAEIFYLDEAHKPVNVKKLVRLTLERVDNELLVLVRDEEGNTYAL
jgi:hypothetical protein